MRGPLPWKTSRARTLRSNSTSAEDKLWLELRNRRLGGFKFVRQAPIGPYFADFMCRDKKLIVEVDGGTHGEVYEIAEDAERTQNLKGLGYRVYRAGNQDIYDNIEGILDELLAILEGLVEMS